MTRSSGAGMRHAIAEPLADGIHAYFVRLEG